ncbi:hypothetical protein [Halomonas sp. JS92-SW72]|uniref:hypothetical protein n=1 Tax=Halomonas sp. JS92-SW72 TaxID=2306583 RepID=UPI0013C2EDA5|nr:hypothetical protein [Halomonas sp. JS92-SW72]
MTTKYAPKPMFSTDAALERLEPARTEYLEKRQALEKEHGELKALRSTLASHRQQAQAAQRQAEEAIRAAKGHETEETISLQEMAIRKERQIRVVESMVAAQEPAVELLRIDTYGARVTYEERLKKAREAAGFDQLHERAAALFQGEEAAPFLRQLPALLEEIKENVFSDTVYMATHGVDVSTITSPRVASAVAPWLGDAQRREVMDKVRKEQMAAIGEIVAQHIPDVEGDALEGANEILKPIEPLSCEADRRELGSGLAVARRRRELVAQMEEQAA